MVRRFSLPTRETGSEPATVGYVPQMLLVEDSLADVGLIVEALEEHHVRCELTVLNNGETALAFIGEIEAGELPCPCLVVLDLNLPRRSGKEVLARLREGDVCRGVPVIVLSSSDDQKDRADVARFAPVRYLRKPSRLDEFLDLGKLFDESLHPTSA